MRHTAAFVAGTILLFTVLTTVMTYPQVRSMTNAVNDVGDPLLNLWALTWVAHQVPRDPAHLFDGNIFAPETRTLAYSETLLAPAVVASPLLWMGMGRVLVYNIVFVLGFILSGVGAALLVRELTGNIGASIVAGVIFAFLPFRFDHYAQLQLQHAEWIPFALWFFHRLIRLGRVRDGAGLGISVACQFLSCMYYGIFLAAYLIVVGSALMLSNAAVLRSRLPVLAVAIAVALALFAPAGITYVRARQVVGERSKAEINFGSARLRNYLATPAGNKLYGWSANGLGPRAQRLFPGLVAVLLAGVALWPPWSQWSTPRAAYAIGLVFALDLTLGFHGLTYRALYDYVLPFHALRLPALASILVGFSLAVLAGFGVSRLSNRLTSRAARAALTVVLCAAVLAEGCATPLHLTTIPGAPPEIYTDLLRDRGDSQPTTLVEIPINREDPTYMYYSTFHWQTLLNGYSGFYPPSYVELVKAMAGFPDERSMLALHNRGTRYLLIHGELLDPNLYQRFVREADRFGAELTLVARRPWQDGEISLYRLK